MYLKRSSSYLKSMENPYSPLSASEDSTSTSLVKSESNNLRVPTMADSAEESNISVENVSNWTRDLGREEAQLNLESMSTFYWRNFQSLEKSRILNHNPLRASPSATRNGWAPMIVLASEGIAADWKGCCLGQYSLAGEYHGSPYYVQSNTLAGSDPTYLYRAHDNKWWISDALGEQRGWLKNTSNSVNVPELHWRVSINRTFHADPRLTASSSQLSECGDIAVTSDGQAEDIQSDCLGVYRRTDIISSGRFVFKHQTREKYLSIPPGKRVWSIGGTATAGIQSAAGANCPASNRNRYSERDNEKSWMYWNNGEWHEDPNITVICTNHGPEEEDEERPGPIALAFSVRRDGKETLVEEMQPQLA